MKLSDLVLEMMVTQQLAIAAAHEAETIAQQSACQARIDAQNLEMQEQLRMYDRSRGFIDVETVDISDRVQIGAPK